MSSATSSLSCQVNGLLKIYTYNKNNAFLEFNTKEALLKAKEAITNCSINNHVRLTSSVTPEYANFAFGISTDAPIKSVGELIRELIKPVIEIITTEASQKKDVPIVPITMEYLIYKA